MEPKKVPAHQVWSWLSNGWRIFMKYPILWMVMIMTFITFVVIVQLIIPGYGIVIVTLCQPALYAGLLYGAEEVANDRPLKFEHLWRAFDEKKLLGMLSLGAVVLLSYYLLLFMSLGTLEASGEAVLSKMTPETAMNYIETHPEMVTSLLVTALVYLLISTLVSMLLIYAAPLVMFEGYKAVDALKSSLMACLRNLPALFAFSVIWMGLSFVAMIPMGMGLLILMPVSIGTLYSSYRAIYR